MTEKRVDLFLRGFLLLNVFVCLGYTLTGLQLNYSYWIDELFSVVAAIQDPPMQWRVFLNDVHPPLYQLILAVWTAILGTSEMATRSLSAIFIGLIIPSFWVLARSYGNRLAFIYGIFLFSNWLLYVYAQEVRSYALLLCLSAWVHTYFLVGERRLLYPLLVALGLTHFFGTLLSCLCLAWLLLERRPLSRNLLPCAISGATILIWPLIFLSVGGGRDVLGGAFWIEASTYDIGHHALSAAFPFAAFLLGVSGLLQYQAAPSVVLFLAALIGGLWAARHMRDAKDQLGQGLTSSLFLLTSFIISVILINYLTPISTTRNFIVLVPTGAFFCASLFITLLSIDRSRTSAMVLLVTFVLINQSVVFSKMLEKFYPLQDLRGAAAELLREVEADPSREVFVFDSFPTLGIPEFNREWFSYYFFGALSVELLDPEDADSVPQNSLVFFAQVRGSVREQGQCSNDLIADLAARDIGYEAWFAKQARECTTGYLLVVDR